MEGIQRGIVACNRSDVAIEIAKMKWFQEKPRDSA